MARPTSPGGTPAHPISLGNPFCGVTQVICKNLRILSIFAYDLGVLSLEQLVDDRLAHGRAHFSREEALDALDLRPFALSAAITRLIKKRRLANPRHGF